MSILLKRTVCIFVFISLLAVLFLSFATMTHGADSAMPETCPFSTTTGTATCPRDSLSIVLHHVAAYNAFVNFPLRNDLEVLLTALLLLVFLALAFWEKLFFPIVPDLPRHQGDRTSLPILLAGKLTSWLSLFEHSPSAT